MSSLGLRVLLVHSEYQTRGGEERALEVQEQLFKRHSIPHAVLRKSKVNGTLASLSTVLGLYSASTSAQELVSVLNEFHPSVIHFHNIMPHWGYGSLAAALQWSGQNSSRVLSTIHNQRWVCSNGLFFRDGAHCQKCFDTKQPFWGALYNCRSSVPQSLLYSSAIASAWARGLYSHSNHTLLALNSTTAGRLREVFSSAKIEVLQNPILESSSASVSTSADAHTLLQRLNALPKWDGPQMCVVGRLSLEKGILRLINSVCKNEDGEKFHPNTRFVFAGDGPLKNEIMVASQQCPRIAYLGVLPESEVECLLRETGALYHAGLVEEQSPTVVRLALSLGIPVWTKAGRLDKNIWGESLSSEKWLSEYTRISLGIKTEPKRS